MRESPEAKVIRLEERQNQMASDISELKCDVKDVKNFLMGEHPMVVTRTEFEREMNQVKRSYWVRIITATVLSSTITMLATITVRYILGG